MTANDETSAIARRDLLVQQLLEERRKRLQRKLFGNGAGTDIAERFEDFTEVLSKEDEMPNKQANEVAPERRSSPKRAPGPTSSDRERAVPEVNDSFLNDVLARLSAAENLEPNCDRQTRPAGYHTEALPSSPSTRWSSSPFCDGKRPQSAPPGGAKAKKPSAVSSKPGDKKRLSTESRLTERSRQSVGGDASQAFEQRLQKWQLQHQATKRKQMQAKQEKEMQELGECTFQPSINTRSEFYARRSRSCFAEPLPERLYHEADKRASLRNKAKELMEADALCSYTFQPNINPSKGSNRAPLHLRAEELRQRREQRVRHAQMAEERRSGSLFQPKISNRSERIVQKKRDMLYRCASRGQVDCLKQLGPVEERLYAEAQEKEQRRAALQDIQEDGLQSFPSVDDTSRRICKYSVYFQGDQQDFLTRQQTFELAKQKRLEVRAQHVDNDCCFQPRITETSRQLVSNNLDMLGETPEERIHRLAVRDAERREQIRVELEQLHRKDCTFKPQINPVSEMLAASRYEESTTSGKAEELGAHERLYRSGLSKSQAGDEWQSGHSFRPQLDPRSSKRYAHIKSRYANKSDLMDGIRQEQEKKAEYLLERRRELEEEKNADCTFAPRVKEVFQDNPRSVAVSGLDRFFELKSLALKKQQEQLEREQRVFRSESVASFGPQWHDGVTVPEPFQLSGEGKDKTKDIRSPALDEDCTFTPQTNQSHNREMIKQIMGMVKVH